MKLVLKRFVPEEGNQIASHVFHWLDAGQSLVVGRSGMEADVVCRDSRMSNRHFQIDCGPMACLLRDLGSTNGTLLNGKRIDDAELSDGDEIRAAETMFNVRIFAAGGVDVDEMDDAFDHPPPDDVTLPMPADDITLHDHPAPAAADGWDLELAAAPAQPPNADDASKSPGDSSATDAPERSSVSPICVTVFVHDGPFIPGDSLVSRNGVWMRPDQTLIVGRSRMNADWAIGRDRHMSGSHFKLSCDNGRCVLTDLESSNCTFLNDVAVTQALLRNKDLIKAGNTVFAIVIEGGETLSDEEVRAFMVRAEHI